MQVKKQQLELDVEQWTGSKLGKEYVKAVYCHPAYLNSVQSASYKMPGWVKHKLESRLPGNINNLRYADNTTLMGKSEEELKSLLMKMEEQREKAGLKTQHSKNKDHGIQSHYFMVRDREKMGSVADFIFLGSKITADMTAMTKLNDACSLEEKLWQT